MANKQNDNITPEAVYNYVNEIFGTSMHLKRVRSLANATIGAIHSLSLAIHIIGQGLAQAIDHKKKHCVKQVDRLLSNSKLNVWEYCAEWVPFIIAKKEIAYIAMDWTEFDTDDHSTIMLSLITGHSRSTPLIWKSVVKSELKGKRNQHEDDVLQRLYEVVPKGVHVVIIADRGFSDTKLMEELKEEYGFDFIIRLKDNTWVTDQKGTQEKAYKRVIKGGRTTTLKQAYITNEDFEVEKVVCVKKPAMKEAWILASSCKDLSGPAIVQYYAKRWGIETNFRDIKDKRYGMGLSHMHTKSTKRRDRLFLIAALSISLLTLLGAAGDAIGLERYFKVNTSKKRCYSFFRQGCMYFEMPGSIGQKDYVKLMKKFYELLTEQKAIRTVLGIL